MVWIALYWPVGEKMRKSEEMRREGEGGLGCVESLRRNKPHFTEGF